MITFDEFLKESSNKELSPASLQSQIGACDVKQYGDKWTCAWDNSNEKNDQMWFDKYTERLNKAMNVFGKKSKIEKTSRLNSKTQMITFTVG